MKDSGNDNRSLSSILIPAMMSSGSTQHWFPRGSSSDLLVPALAFSEILQPVSVRYAYPSALFSNQWVQLNNPRRLEFSFQLNYNNGLSSSTSGTTLIQVEKITDRQFNDSIRDVLYF